MLFYMIIEVKIDADENNCQINRYCSIAESRAGKLPWAVVYLTPDGRKPRSIDQKFTENVANISWGRLGEGVRRSTANAQYIPRYLARNFADYVSGF